MLNKLFLTIFFFFSFVTSYTQTTIHNTFGSGDSYDNTSSYGLTSTGWIASEFTVGSPGYSNITAEAALAGTSNGNLTIEIYSDNGSAEPTGAALASGTIAVTFNDAVVSINFSSLSLNAGIYHLVAYGGTTDGSIYYNSESIMGVGTSSDGGSSWNSVPFLKTPAFRITGATALPVELVSFEGYNTEEGVKLNWETATETNNYGFQIQRKKDKVESEWEDVGFVQGHGTTNSPKHYEFTDSELPNVEKVDYRLKQIDNDGTFAYSKIVTVNLTTITDVYDEVHYTFSLEQNYPNPFNPSTTIKFTVPSVIASGAKQSVQTSLKIYDILGREVATLVNQKLQPGNNEVQFDASALSSGVYFYKLSFANKSAIKKFVLMK